MKRILVALVAAAMMFSTVALAADDTEVRDPMPMPTEYDDISGEAYWPILRGLQWSMNEDVVLLLEKARGVDFELLRDTGDIRIYTAENVQSLGRTAKLIYMFEEGQGLCQTIAQFTPDADEDIDALLDSLMLALTDEYGAPVTDARTDGKFDWTSDDDMIAAWGESDAGVRHQSGEEYLIGALTLEVFKSDSETTLRLNMQGRLSVAQ